MKFIVIVFLATLAAFVAGEAQIFNPGLLGQANFGRPSSYIYRSQSYGGTPASTVALPNSYVNGYGYGFPGNGYPGNSYGYGLQYPSYTGYPSAYAGYSPFASGDPQFAYV